MLKKRYKNWLIVSILSILIACFFLVAIYFGYKLYNSYYPIEKDGNLLVSYNSNDEVTHKVNFKKNSYYDKSENEFDKQLISSAIKDIDFNIKYSFSSSKTFDYIYEYSITAMLVGNYDNSYSINNEIWKKEYPIEPITRIDYDDTNKVNSNYSFTIDYQEFNSIMKGFKDEFNLSINAYLKIVFESNISTSNSNQAIDEDDDIIIMMPLLNDTTYITYENTGVIDKNVWAPSNNNDTITVFPIIIMLVIIVIILYLSTKLQSVTITDKYFMEINKIYNKYKNILVKVDELPNKDDLKLIMVNNFIDMCDVNKETNSPILFYERKNSVEFFIIKDQCYYTYTIKRTKK